MKKEEIILIGGGGHCRSCIDVIEEEHKFRISGIVDVKDKLHEKVAGYEIIATDKDLADLAKHYKYFFITIGQLKNSDKRMRAADLLKKLDVSLPVIISPSAYVSKRSSINEGTIVMHKACINSHALVGKNSIINTAAVIEHDAIIGDFCHISTGSIVNGGCRVGHKTFIGSNSVLSNNIIIMGSTVIGAGSVVIASIEKEGNYAGNPAKRISKSV